MANVEKVTNGAKDAPQGTNYRLLVARILDDNPGASSKYLATEVSEQIRKRVNDGYRYALCLWIVERELSSRARGPRKPTKGKTTKLKKSLAAAAADLAVQKYQGLLGQRTVIGKTNGEMRGPEHIKLGGWHAKIGKAIGPARLDARLHDKAVLKLLDQYIAA